MHIASIEKEIAALRQAQDVVQPKPAQARPAPVPEGGEPGAVAMAGMTDLDGLGEAHTLDMDRVAALLADPLDPTGAS